jgi:hypothetical protein
MAAPINQFWACLEQKVTGIRYSRSLVAFIDILGFSSLIQNSSTGDLGRIRSNVKMAGRLARDNRYKSYIYHGKVFSDCVTMSMKLDKGAHFFFLMNIVNFQAELAKRGIFVRGAVAVGDHFEDSEVMFGKALVRAVGLEESMAIWPRIVVDCSVLRLQDEPNLWFTRSTPDRNLLNHLVRCDSDGISYVDYLGVYPDWISSTHEGTNPAQEAERFRRSHRRHIIRQARANKDNMRVLAKYHWLATYHNAEMGERAEMGEQECEDLEIDINRFFPLFHKQSGT